jgi:signal transduction histidine kinase
VGLGIPAERLDRVFERFFRAHRGAGGPPGLGLGLYISKEIVDRHGGRIWCHSEEGRGATFAFALPLGRGER